MWDLKPIFCRICCFYEMFGFLGRCQNIIQEGFIDFTKSHFYAITTSWHAHQEIRLDKLIWRTTFIELSTKPFETLLFWNLLKTAYVLLYLNIFGILLLGIISGAVGRYWMPFERNWALFQLFRQKMVPQKGPRGIHISFIFVYETY